MTNPQNVVVVAAASSERHMTDLEGGQAYLSPSDQCCSLLRAFLLEPILFICTFTFNLLSIRIFEEKHFFQQIHFF